MADAIWDFRTGAPTWRHRQLGSSGTFDPFPCYAHNLGRVREAADRVAALCPPLWDVEIHVADREEVGRSNGYSNLCEPSDYVEGRWVRRPPIGLIVLSGKRVPPHPRMSDYLVAHEYGHNVEYMVQHARGYRPHGGEVVAEYIKARGLAADTNHHGSGGRWHDSATEIFACDFRVYVCGVETGYWPHPGIPHPDDRPAMAAWWETTIAQLAEHRASGCDHTGTDR